MRNFDGGIDHDRWVCWKPCAVCGTHRNIQAAHVVARGMGGRNGAWYHLVPLCAACHALQESHGNDWIKAERGLDLPELATKLAIEHLTEVAAAPIDDATAPVF